MIFLASDIVSAHGFAAMARTFVAAAGKSKKQSLI